MVVCWGVLTVFLVLMRLAYCGLEPVVTNLSEVLECTINDHCSNEEMCVNYKCVDPCIAAHCGDNADCHRHNHMPMCSCSPGHTFVYLTGCILNDEECFCSNHRHINDEPQVKTTLEEHSDRLERIRRDTCLCSKDAASTNDIDPEGSKLKKTFFLYNDSEMTWNQSLAHCVSMNMTLATINSQEEQDSLFDMIQGYTWWIGGSDLWDPGNYTWVSTGNPLTYSNWWPGQPNNRQHYTGEVQHCMHIGGHTGQWYDYFCSDTNYHVCEHYT